MKRPYLILGLCLWAPWVIPAPNSEFTELSLEELMQVSVSSITKMEMPIEEASMSAYVVGEREIRQRGYRYLIDVLKNTPGVYIVEMSASEKATNEIYIRGFFANRKITVLVDGNRIKPPTGEAITFFARMPLLNVKQVEISLGSASSIYGADAMLATINVVTHPIDDRADIKLTGGSDNTGEVQVSLGKKLTEDFAVNLSGSFQRTDGDDFVSHYPELYAGRDVDLSEHSHNVHLKVEYDDLLLSYYRLFNKRNNSIGFNPAFFDYSGAAFWQTTNQAVNLVYGWDLDQFWQTKTRLSYESTDLDDASNYRAFGAVARAAWDGDVFRFAQDLAYQKGDLNWFNGLEISYFRSTPKIPLDSPELGVIKQHYQNYALFSQLDYRFSDRLKLNAGIRMDYDSRFKPEFNPRLGFSWWAMDDLRVFATWATSYLAAAPYLVHERWDSPTASHRPNPDLKPEKMSTYELGFDWRINARHSFTLSGFVTEARDLVRVQDNSAAGLPNQNVNTASAESYGFHLNSQHQLPYGFSLQSSYQLTMGEQDGEQSENRVELIRVPKHLLQGNLQYHWQSWTWSLRGRWFDHISSHEQNTLYRGGVAKGATILDTNLQYPHQLGDTRLTFDVSVDNLLDHRYYQFGVDDNLNVNDPWGNQYPFFLPQLPQRGRKIYFSVGINY